MLAFSVIKWDDVHMRPKPNRTVSGIKAALHLSPGRLPGLTFLARKYLVLALSRVISAVLA